MPACLSQGRANSTLPAGERDGTDPVFGCDHQFSWCVSLVVRTQTRKVRLSSKVRYPPNEPNSGFSLASWHMAVPSHAQPMPPTTPGPFTFIWHPCRCPLPTRRLNSPPPSTGCPRDSAYIHIQLFHVTSPSHPHSLLNISFDHRIIRLERYRHSCKTASTINPHLYLRPRLLPDDRHAEFLLPSETSLDATSSTGPETRPRIQDTKVHPQACPESCRCALIDE